MSGGEESDLAPAFAQCEALAKTNDYDRWLGSVFAPPDKRAALHALLAFNIELARVREVVSEPRLGEIRLQWWREALDEPQGHPVAQALAAVRRSYNLPLAPFLAMIEARIFDLWNDPAPSLAWLEGYCGETSSSLFRLSSLILFDGSDPGGAGATGHAGVAWALTGLLRALPWHARAGQVYLPRDRLQAHGSSPDDVVARRAGPPLRATLKELRDVARRHLASARQGLNEIATPARPVMAPLALVPLYLARMERPGYDPFASVIELPPWRKAATLWAARGWRR